MSKLDYQPRMAELAKQGKLTEKKARDLDYQTPRNVLDRVDLYYGGQIPLDPATHPKNPTRAKTFFALSNAEAKLTAAWFKAHKTANLKKYIEAVPGPFIVKGNGDDVPDRKYRWRIFPATNDGLRASWTVGVFVNPPYGGPMKAWLEKIGEQAALGTEIIALIPVNRSETAYWQESIATPASVVCWVRRRVAFLRPTTGKPARGNPYASALWGFNVDVKKFHHAFAPLGRVVQQTALPAESATPEMADARRAG